MCPKSSLSFVSKSDGQKSKAAGMQRVRQTINYVKSSRVLIMLRKEAICFISRRDSNI